MRQETVRPDTKGTHREKNHTDLEIPPLGRELFANAVMGKYCARAMAESNVVRIAPDLCKAFPNEATVNQALRELLKIRETLKSITSDHLARSRGGKTA